MKTDVNFSPYKYVYCLMVSGSFVRDFGYIGGQGTWMRAKQFKCYADAKAAIDDPSWHNDPEGVARAEVVRLTVTVEVKFYTKVTKD